MNTTNRSRNSKHCKEDIKLNPKEIQNLKKKKLIEKLDKNEKITFEFSLISKLNKAAIKCEETNDIDVAIILYYISYEIHENELAKKSLIDLIDKNDNYSFKNIYESKVEKLKRNIEQKINENYMLQEKDDEILKLLEDIANKMEEEMRERYSKLIIYLIIFNINKNPEVRTKLINNNFIESSLIIKLARPVDYYSYDDLTRIEIGYSYMALYIRHGYQKDYFEYFEKALDYVIPYLINDYDDSKFDLVFEEILGYEILYVNFNLFHKHFEKIFIKLDGHPKWISFLNKKLLYNIEKVKELYENKIIVLEEEIKKKK